MKKLIKISGVVLTAFTAMLMFGANGEAYIDPSVMTYIIQVVAGIIVAVGAAVGIYWRKAKKKVSNALGVDENRNKEVESDDIIIANDEEEQK